MEHSTIDRHEGHQVKLWVPDALYAALKARAMRHDTNVSDELRKAASAGLEPLDGLDEIHDLLIDLRQFERVHLEPLAYIAAVEAGKTARYFYASQAAVFRQNDPKTAKERIAEVDRAFHEGAVARVKRALRLSDTPQESEENDDQED